MVGRGVSVGEWGKLVVGVGVGKERGSLVVRAVPDVDSSI
jgi:hypothetical protein